MIRFKKYFFLFFILALFFDNNILSQNLVQSGAITNSNANWNGQESPWNATTYQGSYLTACGNNYVMEVDNASIPTQTVSGFQNGANYLLTFRYAYRTVGCGPSNNPTFLRIRFTDATSVLDYTISIPNTVTAFTPFSYTFTNNASTSHTLQFTNPGNGNTCGVIVDDISITRLSSPGGIGAGNVALWFKAETIGQNDNTDVYAWNSQVGTAITVTAPCANRPVYRSGLANAAGNLVANFNPYLTFNGSSQYLSYTAARLPLIDAETSANGASIFSVFQGGGSGRSYFGHRSLTSNSRIDGKTDSLIVSDGGAAGTNNTMRFIHNNRVNICSVKGKENGLTLNDLNGTAQTLNNNSINNDYLSLGARTTDGTTFSRFFNGSLSEIIVFNNIISDLQMHQIRSYLAVKYGVTLNDNSSTAAIDERSYISSNGTTNFWAYTSNSGFHNNVTIIGRDDNTGLNQMRSISTDEDAGSNTGNAMLDISQSADFSSNLSYLAVGHNGVSIPNPGGANFVDVPATIQSRLNRVWKFQLTGTGVSSSVVARFDMTGFAPLTGANLRLLVSNSTVFSGASIITGTYSAPYFSVNLPTTGGVYFTVASTNSVSTPLPIELLSFDGNHENKKVELIWQTASEKNNSYFEIEKSIDGYLFEKIGEHFSKAPSGNSNVALKYNFTDNQIKHSGYYYRIKQVDIDKSYSYSPIIYVETKNLEFKIYPNPNTGTFKIDIPTKEPNQSVDLKIYDQYSQLISDNRYVVINNKITGSVIEVIPQNPLPKGIYICLINYKGEVHRLKLTVN